MRCWSLFLTLAAMGSGVALGAAPAKPKSGLPPPPAKAQSLNDKLAKLTNVDMMVAGGVATALADLCMHPIDTIKTVQQASRAGMSIAGACRKILKDGGPLGFYQGVVPYVTSDGLSGSIRFAFYEWGKKILAPILPAALHGYSHFLCAGSAFVACSFVLVPGELLKQRLQAGVATSLAGGARQIWKEKGFFGFFTGYKATLIRDVPYTMLELGLYDNFKSAIKLYKKKEELTQAEELGAAAVTGAIVGLATNPLDLVKTRLMTGSNYNGFFDVVNKMYKLEGGAPAFLSGASARVMWLLPFTVIQLGVYEVAKRGLANLKKDD